MLIPTAGSLSLFRKGRQGITFALDQGEKVLLGLTSDSFAKGKRQESNIESYTVRKSALDQFLQEIGASERVKVIPIDTIFIPAQWKEKPIEAIIISKDAITGAVAINNKRQKEGKKQLEIIYCPIVTAQDGQPISSFRIRNGEINRKGEQYVNKQWGKERLYLPETMRKTLQKPLGKVIKHITRKPSHVITVGDVVTTYCNTHHITLTAAVIDFTVAREKKYTSVMQLGFSGNEKVVKVSNPAGSLTPELFTAVTEFFNNPIHGQTVILVDGEEDLSVLPILLRAPLGYTIYYGQPQEGMVEITVTEEVKNIAYNYVSSFVKAPLHTRGY